MSKKTCTSLPTVTMVVLSHLFLLINYVTLTCAPPTWQWQVRKTSDFWKHRPSYLLKEEKKVATRITSDLIWRNSAGSFSDYTSNLGPWEEHNQEAVWRNSKMLLQQFYSNCFLSVCQIMALCTGYVRMNGCINLPAHPALKPPSIGRSTLLVRISTSSH